MFKRRANSNTLPHLGELELRVLDALWREPCLSAKDLSHRLTGGSSLNTVQSTLERLYQKNLLVRDKRGHAYRYCARLSRSELASTLIGTVADRLHLGDLEPVLSGFVDFADGIDEDTLNRLETLIRERKRQRMENDD